MEKEHFEAMIKEAMETATKTAEDNNKATIKAIEDKVATQLIEMAKPVNKKDIHADNTSDSTIEVKEPAPGFLTNKGEFFQMVAKAASDPSAKMKLAEGLEGHYREKAPSGLNTLVSSEGGFLPTAEIATEIRGSMYETGQLLAKADVMPLGGTHDRYVWREAVNEDRSTAGSYNGIRAYRVNEGEAGTTSQPAFRERELSVKDLMIRVPVTRQLLADSTALSAMIMKDAPKAANKLIDREIIRGTGAGQCQGILNAPATISVVKETGQPADTIVLDNIEKMYDNLDPEFIAGANWYINSHARKELRNLIIAVGTGGHAVYLPEGNVSGSPYSTLMGIPVIPTNACSKLGDQGDIILANMSQYLIVEKGGIEAAESMHVLFNTNEVMFRFVWRINGMPKPSAQITPENANTADRLSSFITLDARA